MLAVSISPTVMSAGSSCVLTVTLMPPKSIGGATSPPRPCPKAGAATAGRAAAAAASRTAAAAASDAVDGAAAIDSIRRSPYLYGAAARKRRCDRGHGAFDSARSAAAGSAPCTARRADPAAVQAAARRLPLPRPTVRPPPLPPSREALAMRPGAGRRREWQGGIHASGLAPPGGPRSLGRSAGASRAFDARRPAGCGGRGRGGEGGGKLARICQLDQNERGRGRQGGGGGKATAGSTSSRRSCSPASGRGEGAGRRRQATALAEAHYPNVGGRGEGAGRRRQGRLGRAPARRPAPRHVLRARHATSPPPSSPPPPPAPVDACAGRMRLPPWGVLFLHPRVAKAPSFGGGYAFELVACVISPMRSRQSVQLWRRIRPPPVGRSVPCHARCVPECQAFVRMRAWHSCPPLCIPRPPLLATGPVHRRPECSRSVSTTPESHGTRPARSVHMAPRHAFSVNHT